MHKDLQIQNGPLVRESNKTSETAPLRRPNVSDPCTSRFVGVSKNTLGKLVDLCWAKSIRFTLLLPHTSLFVSIYIGNVQRQSEK